MQNRQQRAGRIRGHGVSPINRQAQLIVEETHRPAPGKKNLPRVTAEAMARRRREEVKFKALATGGEGRTTRVQARSAYGQNRSNVKRKPAARRTSPFKKMMRKQTIAARWPTK
jgi:hypothetical protein